MDIISLGLGVQSTALYYMSSMGELPRVEYAIFADLGKEKRKTYEYLKYLLQWQRKNNGIKIIIVRKKNLYKDLLNNTNSAGARFSSIPAFTKNDDGSRGMLRRQCTGEYKIEQVDAEIRRLLGVKRISENVNVWKGITVDEMERMKIPQVNWKTHFYPYCGYSSSLVKGAIKLSDNRKSRTDLIIWYMEKGLPIPPKSSCLFCPFQSDDSWIAMKMDEPKDFKCAVKVDKSIRNSTKKGVDNPLYLHGSLTPLNKIKFEPKGIDLWENCSDECHV